MLFKDISIIDHLGVSHENMYLGTLADKIVWLEEFPPPAKHPVSVTEVYDGSGKVLLPGLYNMHCHVPMTLLRGYGEGLPLKRWLREKIRPFEALLDAEDIYWGSLLGIYEMLASGVVSFSDMYMRLEGIFRAVLESGIKANITNTFAGGEDTDIFQDKAFEEVSALIQICPSAEGRIIAETGITSEYTCSERIIRDVVDWAKDENLALQVHLSETKAEHEECKLRHQNLTPAAYLNSLNFFDRPTVAAHGTYLEDSDLEILHEKGVTICHCPSSNLKLGSGIAPLAKFFQFKVAVTIGTDGASSNNNLNMLEEISLAALLAKGVNCDPSFMKAGDILPIITVNGARAQGRENCGRLEVGAQADLFVMDLDKAHMRPVYDLPANVFHSGQSADIVLTMVDGKVVYRDGVAPGIDLERVLFEVERIKMEKLQKLS
ncbi:MAG: amidohydrolase family protein [Clostridiaceae bacterium]|nr:amidohydrolase family protein [Clostridiaceae bacterium]HZW97760.1 amidohydrolase family protein [Bacillota bacterium]